MPELINIFYVIFVISISEINCLLTREAALSYTTLTSTTEIDHSSTIPFLTTDTIYINNTDENNKNTDETNDGTCSLLNGDMDSLTQVNFLSKLLHPCRYDKVTIPTMENPLEVFVQIGISHIEVEENYLFKLHLMLMFEYVDKRLIYDKFSRNRGSIVGGADLSDKIWTPHIYVPNDRASSLMGFRGNDVVASISPSGKVVFVERISVSIYCWMDLKKFPFDEQICNIYLQTWTYNISRLLLRWSKNNPVIVREQLHLTEFILKGYEIYESINKSMFAEGSYNAGNHSCLIFKFRMARESGYYIMDYFIPSVLLVVTSWVTFWLQADAAPPRVTLGTSTMLAFITLASGQSKHLPKVSYIKASEIWFLGCTVFIFLSMAEFAFVNVIWRRKKKVELKKMKSKYILKSAITPKLARKEFEKEWSSLNSLQKSHSCSSLNSSLDDQINQVRKTNTYNHYLTVHSFPSMKSSGEFNKKSETIEQKGSEDTITIPVPSTNEYTTSHNFASMTPQEVAMWIDKKSRLLFPSAFIIFNIFYWTYVYAL